MTSPYEHTQVAHLVKMGRRRSHSLTMLNSSQENVVVQTVQRKQFLAQLKKERQKHQNNHDGHREEKNESQKEQQEDDDDDYRPVVSRVARADTITSRKKHKSSRAAIPTTMKKEILSTTPKTPAAQEVEEHQTIVTRVAGENSNTSLKKNASFRSAMSTTTKNEISPTTPKSAHVREHEQHQAHITRVPRLDTAVPFKKQISTITGNSSNLDASSSSNGLYLDESEIPSNHLQTSSTNLMSKSQIFDQEFHLDDDKDHMRRNDVKSSGSIKISGRDQHYNVHGRRLPRNSSASFMAAIIAIIIGVIAFAFGLTALILVLLLRSTVANSLATNSTASDSSSSSSSGGGGGSGILPPACSAYITINDPTRSVNAPGYALGCDNTPPFTNQSSPVWMRFEGTGGSTLPLAAPSINLCGTTGTGWYSGQMPASSGQISNGTACFSWYTGTCSFSTSISVANCDSFYIYLLPPPPACMMRYCTN